MATNWSIEGLTKALQGDSTIKINAAKDFLVTNSSDAVLLDVDEATGNVGIGTSTPQDILHLKDTTGGNSEVKFILDGADALIKITNATNVWSIGADNSPDRFVIADSDGSLSTGERFVINSSGNVGIGTGAPAVKLDIDSDVLRLRTAKTPASASATGNQGDICWDASYIYICVATNTWERAAIASW